jgi:hypothetical protein
MSTKAMEAAIRDSPLLRTTSLRKAFPLSLLGATTGTLEAVVVALFTTTISSSNVNSNSQVGTSE